MSKHYRKHPSGIEAIQLCRHESFCRGNLLKYILRAPYKGTELEDMLKARDYLNWEIERLQEAQEASKGTATVTTPDGNTKVVYADGTPVVFSQGAHGMVAGTMSEPPQNIA